MRCSKIQFTIAPGYEILEGWVKALPERFNQDGTTIFKDRNEVKVFHEQGYELNVKAFKLPNLINRYVYVYLRGSKAARSFRNALRFLDYGASTPMPVAWVECLEGGKLRESYYVSLNYKTDFDLRAVLNHQVADSKNILAQWVRFTWSRLHKNEIYHLDYSPGNTLIQKVDGNYQFAVVDLNRMKFLPVGFKMGIRNFRQLDTDEENLRLIASEYAALCGESAEKATALLIGYDRSNKNYRWRKGTFKAWFRGQSKDKG
ncbi:MAG: tyrosine protein kinase [Bacteroidia bacterium]|nr:tyrosine protein kinase [Bacteroidia bacterium]